MKILVKMDGNGTELWRVHIPNHPYQRVSALNNIKPDIYKFSYIVGSNRLFLENRDSYGFKIIGGLI